LEYGRLVDLRDAANILLLLVHVVLQGAALTASSPLAVIKCRVPLLLHQTWPLPINAVVGGVQGWRCDWLQAIGG
jgi:hypothetical protein